MIIGSIAAIFVAVWFYNSAPRSNRNPLHWAIVGFIIYFIVALIWTYFVNPTIKDAAMHSRNVFLMYIARYAYIVVSLAGAIFFNLTVGKKKPED
jgi:Na+/H+-dicarboxylate symporter